MRVVLAFTKRLLAFSADGVIVFGGLGAVLTIVVAELGLPLLGVVAIGLSCWFAWALGRLVDLHPTAQRQEETQQEWLQRIAVFDIAPTDLDGFGS